MIAVRAAATEKVSLEDIVRSHIWLGRKTIGLGPSDLNPQDFVTLRDAGVSFFDEQYVAFCTSLDNKAAWDAAKRDFPKDDAGQSLFEQIVDANCLWFGALKWMQPTDIAALHVAPFAGGVKRPSTNYHNWGIEPNVNSTGNLANAQWTACLERTVALKEQDRNGFMCYDDAGFVPYFQAHYGSLNWEDDGWLVLSRITLIDKPPSISLNEWADLLAGMLPKSADLSALPGPLDEQQCKRLIRNLLTFKSIVLVSHTLASQLIQAVNVAAWAKVQPAADKPAASALHSMLSTGESTWKTNTNLVLDLLTKVFPSDDQGDWRERCSVATFFSMALMVSAAAPDFKAVIDGLQQTAQAYPIHLPKDLLEDDVDVPWQFRMLDDAELMHYSLKARCRFYARVARRKFWPDIGSFCFVADTVLQSIPDFGDPYGLPGRAGESFPDQCWIPKMLDPSTCANPAIALQTAFMYGYKLPFPSDTALDAYAQRLHADNSHLHKTIFGYPSMYMYSGTPTADDYAKVIKILSTDGVPDTVDLPIQMGRRVRLCQVFQSSDLSDKDLQSLDRPVLMDMLRAHIPGNVQPYSVKTLKTTIFNDQDDKRRALIFQHFTDEAEFLQHFPEDLMSNAKARWQYFDANRANLLPIKDSSSNIQNNTNNQNNSDNQNDQGSESKGGLGAGAIVGIVIASVIILGGGTAGLFYYLQVIRKRQKFT